MSYLIEWVTNNNGSKNVLTVDSYFMLNEHVSHSTPAPLTVNNLLRHWIDTMDSQVRWNAEYFWVETSAIVAKSIKILLKPENLMTWHHPTELVLCCVWPGWQCRLYEPDVVQIFSKDHGTSPFHKTSDVLSTHNPPPSLCRRLSIISMYPCFYQINL